MICLSTQLSPDFSAVPCHKPKEELPYWLAPIPLLSFSLQPTWISLLPHLPKMPWARSPVPCTLPTEGQCLHFSSFSHCLHVAPGHPTLLVSSGHTGLGVVIGGGGSCCSSSLRLLKVGILQGSDLWPPPTSTNNFSGLSLVAQNAIYTDTSLSSAETCPPPRRLG